MSERFDTVSHWLHHSITLWVCFDRAHPAEIMNAVSTYIYNTPVDQITAEEIERIAGERPTHLVVGQRQIV